MPHHSNHRHKHFVDTAEDLPVFKLPRIKLTALSALVFGVAMSFGAFAFENNGPCWSCHSACDAARIACVANGEGYCISKYRTCTRTCSETYNNCPIP